MAAWHPVRVTEPLPRSRATVFVQVLVAALFLAVIGGSVGLVLGLRDRDPASGRAGGDGRNTSVPGTGPQQTGPTGAGGPTGPTGASGGSSGVPCPDEVGQQAGRGDLAQVLHVQTVQSEAWICRDGEGALYYAGHRFSDDGRLFLSAVREEGDEYVATNVGDAGTTVYRVSRQHLVIENIGGGEPEVQPVINSDG